MALPLFPKTFFFFTLEDRNGDRISRERTKFCRSAYILMLKHSFLIAALSKWFVLVCCYLLFKYCT